VCSRGDTAVFGEHYIYRGGLGGYFGYESITGMNCSRGLSSRRMRIEDAASCFGRDKRDDLRRESEELGPRVMGNGLVNLWHTTAVMELLCWLCPHDSCCVYGLMPFLDSMLACKGVSTGLLMRPS
jgi:hypothetical protein